MGKKDEKQQRDPHHLMMEPESYIHRCLHLSSFSHVLSMRHRFTRFPPLSLSLSLSTVSRAALKNWNVGSIRQTTIKCDSDGHSVLREFDKDLTWSHNKIITIN
jgi:hypothetical protein